MSLNMTLEDLLEALSLWGVVTLRFQHQWECEIRIPGYLGANLTSYHTGKGSTPRHAAEDAWSKLEEWKSSGKMQEDRDRYLADYAFHKERYEKASSYERMRFDPIRDPGEMLPERPFPGNGSPPQQPLKQYQFARRRRGFVEEEEERL